MSESLGEALPKECARVRKVLTHYKAIGPPGAFAAIFIEQSLQQADKAMISGDIVEMLRCYEYLKTWRD